MLLPKSNSIFKTGSLALVILAFILCSAGISGNRAGKLKVLVFSRTKGWKHTSIPYGIAAIRKLGIENGFDVDTTTNATLFNEPNLKQYAAVIFNCTTGNVLNAEQQTAFERYIQAGGGYVGIHSAADTEYDWPWYDKLMGAHFSSHPHNPNVRKATVEVTDKSHISMKGLPNKWERTDEWYNYKSFYSGINILAYLDENSYEGGTNGAKHPIAWYHEFDGGRAFYTGGGHEDSSYTEPLFLQHLLGGIRYAMGENVTLDFSKSYAKVIPEQNRFVKTVLVNDLNAPMELAVAEDGRIFFTEMNGKLSLYDTKTNKYALVHKFQVAMIGGTGLMGVTLDPGFSRNHYIYLYYSPPVLDEPIDFNLSRFTLNPDNTLNLSSEKVLLKVPVQKVSGAHHGGSLAWDKNGNLYLSTGDSSSPFPSDGYAPIDERSGSEYYSLDSQRSSANTNDFKGKVLRIHPEADGSYTIPEGNLFPKGTAGTKPEIYVMGCRNPYRIAVNPHSSVLYWGEIGPDAGKDSIQGPRGYDEFNQAKKAGNYGWPYFVGNNYAYAKWDFTTKTAGPKFIAEAPVNNSPNNTGLKQLPPAQPAMIWYPYAASKEFPELGLGGRSAMAGSFYSFDKTASSKNKFPEYYDGKLFVFDWMRNWVIALDFDKNENYLRSEPFMATQGDFRRPIDLTFGKDGVMYMLEYGSVYGADNDDARLVKIEYNSGNRPPLAKASISDSVVAAHINQTVFLTSETKNVPELREIAGKAPLRVLFSSKGSKDPDDDDRLSYEWLFDGKTVGSVMPNPAFTYQKPGVYKAILKVSDQNGFSNTDTLIVKVGNVKPKVVIETPSNKSFFWDKKPFVYKVKVSDEEDKTIDPKKIKVLFDYNAQPALLDAEAKNSKAGTDIETNTVGKNLMNSSDCKACHTIDKVSVGPALIEVAKRYKGQKEAPLMLAKKIISGGGGNWGTEHVMSAHPQVSLQDAQEMVDYIFSLTNRKKQKTKLPVQSSITLKEHSENDVRGRYTLSASYTDNGSKSVGPITGSEQISLRNAKVKTAFADGYSGFPRFGNRLSEGDHKSYIFFKDIDLTGIKGFTYEYGSQKKDGEIEVRIDSQAGPVISRTAYKATGDLKNLQHIRGNLNNPVSGKHDVYFFVIKKDKPNDNIILLTEIDFEE